MLRGVIFDFDGTLVDSNTIKYDCFFEVARALPGSGDLLNEILANPDAGDRYAVFEQLFLRHPFAKGTDVNAAELATRYTELCEARVACAPEIAGARGVLNTLRKAGLHLAISSATPQKTLQQIVAARGLSEFFDDVLGTPEEKTSHINQVMQHTGTEPKELVYVGDSEIDQQTALAKGCHFIGIGANTERFVSRPHHLVSELPQILPILEKIGAARLE